MAFDITTARPIKTGGFDITTAKPFYETAPEPKSNVNVPIETIKGVAKTAGESFNKSIVQPIGQTILHPVQTVKSGLGVVAGAAEKLIPGRQPHEANIEALGDYLRNRYSSTDNIAKTVAEDPFGFLGDVFTVAGIGGAGLRTAGKMLNKPALVRSGSFPRTSQFSKDFGKATVETMESGKKVLQKIPPTLGRPLSRMRDYGANKTNAIRKAFWENYAPEQYKLYGDAIENLPKEVSGKIKGDAVLMNIEKSLVDRQLMAPDGTMLRPLGLADMKLIKGYQNLYKKWANSSDGMIDIKDFVDEYKTIKGSHTGKPSTLQRANIEAANTLFNSASDQINAPAFSQAKAQYRIFKENQELIDGAIGLYGPAMKTAKGERFLMEGGLSKTTQARKTTKLIEKVTGQRLRGAKVWSKLNEVNPVNLIRPKLR